MLTSKPKAGGSDDAALSATPGLTKPRDSRIFAREEHDHYIEPFACSERLFEVETFSHLLWDPACGWGRIVASALAAGYAVRGTDIVDRYMEPRFAWSGCRDFLACEPLPAKLINGRDVVCNPPFDLFQRFAKRALSLPTQKVAMIWLWRRLPAAGWLASTPLARVWLMTPRPSMPTGEFIKRVERGERDPKTGKPLRVGGGTQDFAWLVWDKAYAGKPEMMWLTKR